MTDPIQAERPPGVPDPTPPDAGVPSGHPVGAASRGWVRNLLSWVVTIAVAVGLTLVVKAYLFTAYSIPSESMVPTLQIDDRVIVSRLSRDPSRGDIIVFDRPANDPKTNPTDPDVLIKRVIGLPGETIGTDEAGRVTIDGRALDEPYLIAGTVTSNLAAPIEVGPNQLLVMGDNRVASQDGRSFGPIDKDLVVGRAVIRFWPLSRMGRI